MALRVFAVLCALVYAASAGSCDVSNKVDCGYSGINQQQCEAKGCCWVPVNPNPNNNPWCFVASTNNVCDKLNFTSSGTPFSQQQVDLMYKYFTANINIGGQGGVVASPDTNVPEGGSYYYHWERDGALSMRALQEISSSNVTGLMNNYAQWVLRAQSRQDPHGIDVRTEPKYMLPNGEVFTGSWCRPQTDGPGLRATTLILHANKLIQSGDIAFVKQYLWTGSSTLNGGAIKYDLEWVAENWSQNGCDLWEEIESPDFFWNRFNFQRSMVVGAQFASQMGDTASASKYSAVATAIGNVIRQHWNQQFVFETNNRQKDAAVISAFNDGYSGGDFGPTSVEVASTIKVFNQLFCNSYSINQKDTKSNIPGILYGRYEGDHYSGGNPWILTSASLAELFYRGASVTLDTQVVPEPKAYAVWQSILNIPASKTLTHLEFARAMASAGDSVLNRIAYHVAGDNFHLAEQIDKDSGFQKSATDLTWSYANVLKAMHIRQQVFATLSKH
eukprot:TRINITY_DN3302_c0_g1_i1.p1 TRINITY_DN3302_c0_g1~~TRINITY_DN3302_c0_g1_i1.p1  ORF type:complete len:503 (+),score=114.35 TRINITY_DN3302_c0_g1_i1:19-1527(+)